MLGFSALAETPLAQATTQVAALGFLSSTVANTNAGTFDFNCLAFITIPSATASGIANSFGDADAQATASVLSTLSSFTINDLDSVIGKANTTPSAAVAAFTTPAYSKIDAQANITFPTATSNFTITDLDFSADSSITISNISASVNNSAFSSVSGQAAVETSSASSLFAINDFAEVTADARSTTPSVESTVISNNFDIKAEASATLNSTSALLTIFITDFEDEDAQAKALLLPAVAATSVNIEEATGVIFDYETVKDEYSRQRVSYVSGAENNTTVYVNKEETSYTVYVTS